MTYILTCPSENGLVTARLLLVSIAMLICSLCASAQYVLTNPLEWMALSEGNEMINDEIKGETRKQLETAALQNTIAGEFTKIHEWERKYSQYLQTAEGYASSVKAATTLYHDGVGIFLTLAKMRKAVSANPEGIAATMSMNNLYMETTSELIGVFTALKEAVAEGGTQNMLSGAERSQTLWLLQDRISAFGQKLRHLYLSLRYHAMVDVWNSYTAGMIDRDNGQVARQAHSRWIRTARRTQ